VAPVAPPTQQVTFDDADLQEDQDDDEDEEEGSEGTEDDRSELNLGEEEATIEFEDLDKKTDESKKVEEVDEEEDDPLKEIEGKATDDTLVLNL
jgi:hypothetical protein